jgi:metallo-beta-lactamase family protein
MHITFLGGTGTVTGSKYLVEHQGHRVLVDCGLFQGLKQLRLRNWLDLTCKPSQIDAVVLSHAHLDHSGFLPRLIEQGFTGRVHSTAATRDLCGLLLPDSGHLMEEEALYANRHGFSRHQPALPLYTEQQARQCMERFSVHAWGQPIELVPGLTATFTQAGHVLGAASVKLHWNDHTVLFSGDLGRSDDLLMRPPEPPPAAQTVVIESTYGDRQHADTDVLSELAQAINRTVARGGMVIVPSFAVGRAQTLLFCIAQLKAARRIPDLPVYLNSPMAAHATELYARHASLHRLSREQATQAFDVATVVEDVEASKRLNALRWPSVIISASGMASGGRVLHHLKAYAPDARNMILFAGYQAMGTRGAAMVGGATSVKIHGSYVPVRAEVVNLSAMSSHADREELLAWIGKLPAPPKQVFVTHGEPVASDALRVAIGEQHRWPVVVPEHNGRYRLG